MITTALILCVSCDKNVHDNFGGIYGKVTDLNSGTPIHNASVTLSPTGQNVLTNSDGFYEFVKLESQQYTVSVQHVEYVADSRLITVRPREESELVNFLLLRK